MSQQTQRISRTKRKALLRRLKAEVGPHLSSLYKGAFFSWIQFLMRILSFYLIAQLISNLYQEKAIHLMSFVLILLGLSIIGYLASILARQYQGVASQHARNKLKTDFLKAFEDNAGEFDDNFTMADLMVVASQGIDHLDTYFQHYLSISLKAYLNCTTILLLVAFIYPMGGVVFLLCLPLIPVSILLMQKRSKTIMEHYWATYMDVGNLFMDDLKGLNTLYVYGADERYEQTFIEKAEIFRQSTMTLLRFQLESVGYMDGVMYLGVGISGFFAARSLASDNLSLLSLIFFVLIAAEFFAPIREMGYGMHLVMMNTKMADRIYTFLDSVNKGETKEVGQALLNPSLSELVLDHVSFSYDADPVLNDLSVRIPKGQVFAIAGESGRGKTTLAKIIQKQLIAQTGEVYLDGQPLSTISQKALQENILFVSPNSYLFNKSVYDNLTFGADMTKEEVLNWLASKKLLPFLKDLPEGLDTMVGENGSRLSPGQVQQIILARSILVQRSIYIFDEMTSSIDASNEQVLFDYIKLAAKQAIVLFISHKMKQVLQADQVLFMGRNGQAQVADPEELLKTNPEFATLVATQKELEDILGEY